MDHRVMHYILANKRKTQQQNNTVLVYIHLLCGSESLQNGTEFLCFFPGLRLQSLTHCMKQEHWLLL